MRYILATALVLGGIAGCGGDDGGGPDMEPDPEPTQDAGMGDASEPDPEPDAGGDQPDTGRPPVRTDCGNGVLEDGEECDDGDNASGDGCSDACVVEDGFRCVVEGADCEQCGNSIVESSEECDDGNRDTGDGCDDSCAIEPGGWVCPLDGFPCELCGDGVLALNEICDEGSSADGVGCSEDCRSISDHFACPTPGQPCEECGNGSVGGNEVCDDGNTESGDGCTFNCKAMEPGYVCDAGGGDCTLCGNGVIEGVEECDDGNFQADDGCSELCALEAGAVCPIEGKLCSVCGNGVKEAIAVDGSGAPTAFEACDEGALADGVGCIADCTMIDTGWSCPVAGLECGKCGNGIVEEIEACDEGATPIDAAGCSNNCTTIDAHYSCPQSGGECAYCGDGVVDATEVCDNGVDPTLLVAVGGDGCSFNCQRIETGWNCYTDELNMTLGCARCGNGKVEVNEACDDRNTVGDDGCSADCSMVEDTYNCPFPGFACVQCGNGVIEPGEECDEGQIATPENDTEGCNEQCRIVKPWICLGAGQPCVLCGDGQLDPAVEECDDGNVVNDDGCSSVCLLEPGYDCSASGCAAAACGDGVRAGDEECDDGNQLAGDGCSFVCQVEDGYVCPGQDVPCRQTVCGDGAVEGDEECDDMGSAMPGCDADCQLEIGYACPTPGADCVPTTCGDGVVEGAEQCDDGMQTPMDGDGCDVECQLEWGYECPTAGEPCVTTECGDGLVRGLEECDDADDSMAGDGCTGCLVDTFYRCSGEPSVCTTVIKYVAIRKFNITNVDPEALIYDPTRRSFGGYKASDGNKTPIELCLDGTVIDPNNTTAGTYGTIYSPGGATSAVLATYKPYIRPIAKSVTLVGSAYDPFTDHYLFLTVSGSTFTLTEVSRDYNGSPAITNFQETLSGLAIPRGLTVGEDGELYVVDNNNGSESIKVFQREWSGGVITPVGNTSFKNSPTAALGWSVPTTDELDAIFTVPGEDMLGIFNTPGGESTLYFRFYDPAQNPELIGRSKLPGELFTLGSVGVPYTQEATAAETAADGGSFVVCPASAGEPCQLFARACATDSDCNSVVPGTSCNTGAAVPYCNKPGLARDDRTTVAKNSAGTFIDVLANDSLSESACVDPTKKVVAVDTTGTQGTVTYDETGVTYDAPDGDVCGIIDTFKYTADLGGGVLDDATVRVLIACICGDGTVDPNEQCDDGDPAVNASDPAPHNGDPESKCLVGCVIRIECGDGYVDPGEECDDNNLMSGDGCSSVCTLESVCGDLIQEGVEECDDGNTMSGDGCNANCTLPVCGDGSLDFDVFEQCDDGNTTPGDGCSNTCQIETECGNGIIEINEQCDDGGNVAGDGCSPICTIETACGDGVVDAAAGEECDVSAAGDQCGPVDCTAICVCENYCGDGRVGGLEECDGEADCRAAGDTNGNGPCTYKRCGDGYTDADLNEQCDDGNTNPADGCTNACTLITACGNGTIEGSEECDDGNNVSGDGCSSACKKETATCGDGVKHFTEQCDDGNLTPGDGCDASCRIEGGTCGDGVVGPGEECDDGANGVAGDGCRDDCTAERCGDHIKDPNEQCDDGNNVSGDGCSATCRFEVE